MKEMADLCVKRTLIDPCRHKAVRINVRKALLHHASVDHNHTNFRIWHWAWQLGVYECVGVKTWWSRVLRIKLNIAVELFFSTEVIRPTFNSDNRQRPRNGQPKRALRGVWQLGSC
jgi:hypothetical protein